MHVTIFSHEADIVRAKIIDVPDGEAFLDLTLTTTADLHQDQVFIDLTVAREIAKAVEAWDQGLAHETEPISVYNDGTSVDSMRARF